MVVAFFLGGFSCTCTVHSKASGILSEHLCRWSKATNIGCLSIGQTLVLFADNFTMVGPVKSRANL